MFYIILSGYNSRTIQAIKFKFAAFLSLVKAIKYVKFHSARCTGFKVDIFRISPTKSLSLRGSFDLTEYTLSLRLVHFKPPVIEDHK